MTAELRIRRAVGQLTLQRPHEQRGEIPLKVLDRRSRAAEIFQNEGHTWRSQANEFRQTLLDALSQTRFHINGDPDHSIPHILNVSFDGVDAEALIVRLKDVVAVSTGSACTSASYSPSHVLRAVDLPEHIVAGALRLSWFPSQTQGFDPKELAAVITEFQH